MSAEPENQGIRRWRLRGAITLGILACLSTMAVFQIAYFTDARIASASERALLKSARGLLGGQGDMPVRIDRTIWLEAGSKAGSNPLEYVDAVYRIESHGRALGYILSSKAPDGYGGTIFFLLGIDREGVITGVEITRHAESPGYGDQIHQDNSQWLMNFTGGRLRSGGGTEWRLVRDGGRFDALSGATISSAAMIKALHGNLQLFKSIAAESSPP